MTSAGNRIPVALPQLPPADVLYPYIRRIDGARVYSNFGPLVRELEDRFAEHFGLPAGCAVTAANATVGISAALIASATARSGRCLLPSWTFCASAHAAIAAGLEPLFADVDQKTWQLTPAYARQASSQFALAAVMPVAADGMAVNAEAWDAFSDETKVPVVIDAAAAFANQRIGRSLVVISLHATKIMGVGEGAVVLSTNADLIRETRRALNFGFHGERDARSSAFNGKMSEYTAAVGLAAMDAWPESAHLWRCLKEAYMDALRTSAIERPHDAGLSSTLTVRLPSSATAIAAKLSAQSIDTRFWYGRGVHRQTAFEALGRMPMPVTDSLAEHCIGLPFFSDMTMTQVRRVADALGGALVNQT